MLISEIDLVSPVSLQECLKLLSDKSIDHRLIAGGTDAAVRMKEGKWRPEVWINIKGLHELRYISEKDGAIHIGPLTTHTDIIRHTLLQKKADVLVEAAREVGAIQMQNMGTIGGNIGTASPAGDTIPALYVLGAVIELRSLTSVRLVPIEEFFIGPGKTILKKKEMITNIIIPPQKVNEIGIFQKLGPRKAQSISIVNVAISLLMGKDHKCLGGKIAFGAVAPTIIRAKKCEALLTHQPLTDEMIQNIGKIAWKEVMPITDGRATAAYRRDMASSLLARGLYRLLRRWENDGEQ
jgi:xanthine dehydrogenase FAD-binding subunit